MKTKISYYVALSVVTLGAMAAVVLSNNGSQGDNNFKNNGEVIYLNKQNLVGEAVGESTLKFDSSKMFAFYDKTKDSKESLRFAVAVKGEIDSINYTRAAIDGSYEEQVESITKVYRGLEVEGNTFYYDGATLTTNEAAKGKYYWAVYNINYDNTVTDKIVGSDEVIKFALTINGNETVSLSSSLESAKLGGGDGSETNPYLIYSQTGWTEFKNNYDKYKSSNISLNLNILEEVKAPFGEFSGTFNGNGNDIKLEINNGTSSNTALFSTTTSSAVIKNLNVSGSVTGGANTAGFVGTNFGTIDNCTNNATINSSSGRAAGIAAYTCNGSAIINCYNNKGVNANSLTIEPKQIATALGVGGIVGTVEKLSNDYLSKNKIVVSTNKIEVNNCHNTGEIINSGTTAGGVVGIIRSGDFTLDKCTNSANVTSKHMLAGGIVGLVNFSNVTISNCVNEENSVVTGAYYVGGITGAFGYDGDRTSTMEKCINNGKIVAKGIHTDGKSYRIGGISGMCYGSTITECTNNGEVLVESYSGDTELKIADNYDTSSYRVAYIAGYKTKNGKVTSCTNNYKKQ